MTGILKDAAKKVANLKYEWPIMTCNYFISTYVSTAKSIYTVVYGDAVADAGARYKDM